MSPTDLRTRVLRVSQRWPPRRSSCGVAPPQRLIFLNQVNARERHVEPRVVGIAQQHEFAGGRLDGQLAQAIELPDAVIHVHHVIARLQIGKIAEKRSARRAATRPRLRWERFK